VLLHPHTDTREAAPLFSSKYLNSAKRMERQPNNFCGY